MVSLAFSGLPALQRAFQRLAHQAQRKAQRIYEGMRRLWHGPGPDDDAPAQVDNEEAC